MNPSSHIVIKPKVLYPGTPVMLLCTQNPNGSTNISPASSYWALGQILVLGLLADGQTAANLHERPGLTVNFPAPELWQRVESIANTTGADPVPESKLSRYIHERDKFGRAGLTPHSSEVVAPPRIRECALQFEAEVRRTTPGWVTTSWSRPKWSGSMRAHTSTFPERIMSTHVNGSRPSTVSATISGSA